MLKAKEIGSLLKAAATDWMDDKAPRLGAALAYYTIFSLAPMLIIAIALAGIFFGKEASQGMIETQLQNIMGAKGAETVQEMISNAHKNEKHGTIAAIIGIITLLFGASGVFGQLQDAMNTIWEVKPKPGRGVKGFLRDRFTSFTMVLVIAFLLLVSLILSSLLTAFGEMLPFGSPAVMQVLNIALSFLVITLLFAMIFKIVPDANVRWKDVWVGAAITSLLFAVGKLLLSIYLAKGSATSVFGAAGSLVVLLIWVYYSAQILFFGAEFTQAYAIRYGSKVTPSKNAVPLTVEERAHQGLTTQKAPHGQTAPPPQPESPARATEPLPGRSVPVTAFTTEQVPTLYKPAFLGFSLLLLVNAYKAIRGKKPKNVRARRVG